MKIIFHIFFIFLFLYPKFGMAAKDPLTGGLLGTNGPKTGRFIPSEPVSSFQESQSTVINLKSALERYHNLEALLVRESAPEESIKRIKVQIESIKHQIVCEKKSIDLKEDAFFTLSALLKPLRRHQLKNTSLINIKRLRNAAYESWVDAIEDAYPSLKTQINSIRFARIDRLQKEFEKGWLPADEGASALTLKERLEDLIPGDIDDDEFSEMFKAYIHKTAIYKLTKPHLDLIKQAKKIRITEQKTHKAWKILDAGGVGAPPFPRSLNEIIAHLKAIGWSSEEGGDDATDSQEKKDYIAREDMKIQKRLQRLSRGRSKPVSYDPRDLELSILVGMDTSDASDDEGTVRMESSTAELSPASSAAASSAASTASASSGQTVRTPRRAAPPIPLGENFPFYIAPRDIETEGPATEAPRLTPDFEGVLSSS